MNGFLTSRRFVLFAATGGVISRLSALGAAVERLPASVDGHSSNLTARINLRGGTGRNTTRLITVQGVGCPVSMCSRVAIKGNAGVEATGDAAVRVWMDEIAAIRDTTETYGWFELKDGSRQRLSLLHDFRVLYFADQVGRAGKVDLAKVESLDFLTPAARK
jgi:hypothetical protein